MKKIHLAVVLFFALFSTNCWTADLTIQELTGEWEFMHWAESGDLDNKHKVEIVMDFRPDGTVITKMSSGDVIEHYELDGNSIIYSGKNGDQVWKLVSFSPGKSLVVNNMGSIMSFERR